MWARLRLTRVGMALVPGAAFIGTWHLSLPLSSELGGAFAVPVAGASTAWFWILSVAVTAGLVAYAWSPVRRLSKGMLAVGLIALISGCGSDPGGEPPVDLAEQSLWTLGPPLPRPVANNAVVGLDLAGEAHVYSFLGIDETKSWDGVRSWAFRWVLGREAWEELPPVPGPGRLAATAESWGGRVYLFGGYTVAEDGSERSVPNVDVFDPTTGAWSAATPIPVPVDDAVSGVWQDSLIVLVSGWHDTDNVPDVQFYDPRADSWSSSTPTPGPPVFGHAGKVVEDRIVYLGGANTSGTRPRFLIEPSAWLGAIGGETDPEIRWDPLPAHPGPPRYRAASVSLGDWVVFAGGTDNPYNYSGIGYDGVPAMPLPSVFAFHGPTGTWVEGPDLPEPRMDHRALARAGDRVVLAGGMDAEQSVTAEVFVADAGGLTTLLRAGRGPS